MVITKKRLFEHCTVIKKLKEERFFAKVEDNYFTIYEKNGNIVGAFIEVSFSDVWMTEDEFWGIVGTITKGHNIFIEKEAVEKIIAREEEVKRNFQNSKKDTSNIISIETRIKSKELAMKEK